LDGFTAMGIHRARAECMLRLGDIWKNRGDEEQAKQYWLQARPLFQRSSQGDGVRMCEERLVVQL